MASGNSQNRVSWLVAYGNAPLKGSRCMAQILDFSISNPLDVNLSFEDASERLEYVQTLYIDNSLNPNSLTIVARRTGQSMTIPANNQAYIPALATADNPHFQFSTTGTPLVPVQFLSFPMAPQIWYAGGAVAGAGLGLDGSGAIVTGATTQNLFGGTVPVNGFGLYNPDATNDLWVSNSTTAAPNAQGSKRVAANGGWYETPNGMKPYSAISVYGAVTGQKFTAERW